MEKTEEMWTYLMETTDFCPRENKEQSRTQDR